MSDIMKNMSAPPRSEVAFRQEQLKKYVAFNPLRLSRLLVESNYKDDLSKSTKQYVEDNPDIIKNIKKPTGYMIAEYVELTGDKYTKALNDKLDVYKYVECTDLELIILVLCSTVGDLYVPDRPLSFEKTKFNKILLFAEEEVNS